VESKESSAEVTPQLYKTQNMIRRLGREINGQMATITGLLSPSSESDPDEDVLNDLRTGMKTFGSLHSHLRCAADMVSTASTAIGADIDDRGSDFEDVLPQVPSKDTLHWIESNRTAEKIEPSAGHLAPDKPVAAWESDDDPDLEFAQQLLDLGRSKAEENKYEEAEVLVRRCIDELNSSGSTSTATADLKNEPTALLVTILFALNKFDDSEKFIRGIIEANSRNEKYSHTNRDSLLLARVLLAKKNFTEAHLYAKKAWRGFKKTGGDGSFGQEDALNTLARICHECDNKADAEAYSALLDKLKKEGSSESKIPSPDATQSKQFSKQSQLQTSRDGASPSENLVPEDIEELEMLPLVPQIEVFGSHTNIVSEGPVQASEKEPKTRTQWGLGWMPKRSKKVPDDKSSEPEESESESNPYVQKTRRSRANRKRRSVEESPQVSDSEPEPSVRLRGFWRGKKIKPAVESRRVSERPPGGRPPGGHAQGGGRSTPDLILVPPDASPHVSESEGSDGEPDTKNHRFGPIWGKKKNHFEKPEPDTDSDAGEKDSDAEVAKKSRGKVFGIFGKKPKVEEKSEPDTDGSQIRPWQDSDDEVKKRTSWSVSGFFGKKTKKVEKSDDDSDVEPVGKTRHSFITSFRHRRSEDEVIVEQEVRPRHRTRDVVVVDRRKTQRRPRRMY
jgi:tetratricopeptide (TPR) repeat protein